MKKMMIMAVVGLLAIAGQAATVDWKVSYAGKGVDWSANGATVMAFAGSDYADIVNLVTVSGSETLAADVEAMMAKVAQSQSVVDNKYYDKCPVLIDELTALIATVNAGYTVSTGIGGVLFDEADAVIYDARGRKVKNITSPGIYIVNGKKIYVK